jgi:endonuclease/exonuclease/phosphatase family metal-dependent hydrolase
MDRCIVSEGIGIVASAVCFNHPSADDASLWPSDHAGVWADLELE